MQPSKNYTILYVLLNKNVVTRTYTQCVYVIRCATLNIPSSAFQCAVYYNYYYYDTCKAVNTIGIIVENSKNSMLSMSKPVANDGK